MSPPPSTPSSSSYPPYPHFRLSFPSQHILHVEINRPEKLNAFSIPMIAELKDIFERVRLDKEVRCVVLTGAGERAFTAGIDVHGAFAIGTGRVGEGGDEVETGKKEGEEEDSYRKARRTRATIAHFQEALSAVESCGKPVISLLHGISYGLALDLACCTDIRVCTRSTRFALKEVDLGIAADLGTLTRLPKIVGSMGWVKEVAYTCREFDGAEAHRVGFVSTVCEDKKAAWEQCLVFARVVVAKSPVAIESTKELLDWGVGRPVADGLRYTQIWNAPAILSGDVTEAITATLQKRKPRFEKL